jgi:hypothetical protein
MITVCYEPIAPDWSQASDDWDLGIRAGQRIISLDSWAKLKLILARVPLNRTTDIIDALKTQALLVSSIRLLI